MKYLQIRQFDEDNKNVTDRQICLGVRQLRLLAKLYPSTDIRQDLADAENDVTYSGIQWNYPLESPSYDEFEDYVLGWERMRPCYCGHEQCARHKERTARYRYPGDENDERN